MVEIGTGYWVLESSRKTWYHFAYIFCIANSLLMSSVFNLAMRNDRERRRKLKYSRGRPSQPPGRFGGVHLWALRIEYDEVKGISPESETKPRKLFNLEMPIPYRRAQAKRPRMETGESLVRSPGVADSIESCEGCGSLASLLRNTRRQESRWDRWRGHYIPKAGSGKGRPLAIAQLRGQDRGKSDQSGIRADLRGRLRG